MHALLKQNFSPRAYEIVVADDATSAETARQVEAIAARSAGCAHTLRYVPVSGAHGPAAARNAAWRAAQGQVIAFTDDDCVPLPGWLSAGVGAFEDGVVGAMGRVIVPLPDEPTDYERDAARLEEGNFVTCNCFYRRDLLEEVGGFDESFTAAWREDTDLWLTLVERGCRLVVVPEAVVVHPVRPARWGVSVRQQSKSRFNALLRKKHPATYFARIEHNPPWRYYRIVGALLLALLGAIMARRWLALLAWVVWGALTARFCLYRLEGTSHAPRHVAEMVATSALIPPLSVFWRIYGAVKYRVWFL